MKHAIKSIGIYIMLCVGIMGCTVGGIGQENTRTTNTYVVVVGMENSKLAGDCPGAGYDADRMYKQLSKYTQNIVLLRDSNATKANVSGALKNAISKAQGGLVIFYYSGHGGSDPFPDTGLEEIDGKDEYLCLWDSGMRDNEIWNIISQSKGRVFMMVDACHSQTMFRHVGMKLSPPLSWDHTLQENREFSMLCWSGCPDNTYSYGSAQGGQFTNALFRYFNENSTYADIWERIKSDSRLRRYENPQSTVLGTGFEGRLIFR